MTNSDDNVNEEITLPLLSLNVCGLVKKLDLPIFIEKISKYKVILFQETKTDVIDKSTVEVFCKNNNFTCLLKIEKKCKKKSGGLITFISNNILTVYRR